VEQRARTRSSHPRLFRGRNFALAQLLSFLVGAILLAVVNYLPQYMQFVQGASSTVSGLLLLPVMLGMLAAQLTTGRLMGQGRRDGSSRSSARVTINRHTPAAPSRYAHHDRRRLGAHPGHRSRHRPPHAEHPAHHDEQCPSRDMGAATGTVSLMRTIGGSLGVAVLGAVYVNGWKACSSNGSASGPGAG